MSDLVLGSTTVLSDSSGTPTIQSGVGFPAGMILQTVRDNYTSTAETSSSYLKILELPLTTKKANSKLAFWLSITIGGVGDSDNLRLNMTLETGATANNPSSSNYLPSDNRGGNTNGQNNGFQLWLDVMDQGTQDSYYLHTYSVNDVITTSYAKDTQITMGTFVSGGCYINRSANRANSETGLTTLMVQEIAT